MELLTRGVLFVAVELFIANGTTAYLPPVQEGIEWSTERCGVPGKLTFKVVKDSTLNFTEGCPVKLSVDGKGVFFGFVFKQQRDKNNIITVTAYDQLRYLKNKDTYVYTNKTASQFIKMIADDFNMNVGSISNTGYRIASRVEDNTSLFDMIQNALDLTLENTGEMFVFYDDCGKLTLKNLDSMRVGSDSGWLVIDEDTGQNFDYESSIDDNTYNQIKLVYENESTGRRDVYMAQDSSHINDWGVLQYFATLKKGENGKAKVESLLELYNAKTRRLKINKAIGDNRVRAGSMIVVNLNLGDMHLQNFMLVEKCSHTYYENEHWMDLTLRGGEFVG